MTNAWLRDHQTLVSAIIGFAGVCMALLYTGYKDRQIKELEAATEAKSMDLSLYLEVVNTSDAIRRIEKKLYEFEKDRETLSIGEATSRLPDMCWAVKPLREIKLAPLAMFASHKQNLGKLPGDLAYRYMAFSKAVTQLTDELSSDTFCKQPHMDHFISGKRIFTQLARYEITSIQEGLWEAYPGFRSIKNLRLDNTPYKPTKEQRTGTSK